MSEQAALELAREAGERGMALAAQHAERECPGWSGLAYVFLVKWCTMRARTDRFTAEAVTDAYAADSNFVQPPDQRAWGGVFKRAVARGVLTVADFNGVRAKGHGTTGAKRYRSLVVGRQWSSFDWGRD